MEREKRHLVYKAMLSLYNCMVAREYSFGFCALINPNPAWIPEAKEEKYAILLGIKLEDLEELIAYKPNMGFFTYDGTACEDDDQFWFRISNTEARIKILEDCIKETEE